MTAEIYDEKKSFGCGTWVGFFDSVFRIFAFGHFLLVLASDVFQKTCQTELHVIKMVKIGSRVQIKGLKSSVGQKHNGGHGDVIKGPLIWTLKNKLAQWNFQKICYVKWYFSFLFRYQSNMLIVNDFRLLLKKWL